MKRLLSFFLLFLLCLVGCSEGGSTGLAGGGSGGLGGSPPVGGTVQPGQQLFGRIQVAPVAFLTDPQAVQLALTQASALQQRGYQVEPTGKIVAWPKSPGSGWVVQVGTQTVVAGPDGSFTITVPADGDTSANMTHPTETELVPFSLASMAQSSLSQPTPLVVVVPFRGPCGMSYGDLCGGTSSQGSLAQKKVAELVPNPPTDAYHPDNTSTGPLGNFNVNGISYPPSNDQIHGTCPQNNGPFQHFLPLTVPVNVDTTIATTQDGAPLPGANELVAYLGSTCDYYVLAGACPNEQLLSDIELASLQTAAAPAEFLNHALTGGQGLFVARAFAKNGGLLKNGTQIHCADNHRGRLCGMFLPGDLALAEGPAENPLVESTVRNGATRVILVGRGDSGALTVHNNGTFGITEVGNSNPAAVQLGSGPFLLNVSPDGGSLRHQRLLHYTGPFDQSQNFGKLFKYSADRTLNYQILNQARGGDAINCTLAVDQSSIVIQFQVHDPVRLLPPATTVDPQNLGVLSNAVVPLSVAAPARDQLQQLAQQGATVRYHWSVSGNAGGKLSAVTDTPLVGTAFNTTTSDVHYLTSIDAQRGQQDQIQLDVYVTLPQPGAIKDQLFGTATSIITLSGVTLQPNGADLLAGGSQSFTVVAGAQPGDTLSFAWSLANGQGTLSSTTDPTTTYTAPSAVQSPVSDTLQVNVTATNGNGNSHLLGSASAALTIEPTTSPSPTPSPTTTPTPYPPLPPPMVFLSPKNVDLPASSYPYPTPTVSPQILRQGDLYTISADLQFSVPGDFSDTRPDRYTLGTSYLYGRLVAVDGVPWVPSDPAYAYTAGWTFYRQDLPGGVPSGIHSITLKVPYPGEQLQISQGYVDQVFFVGPWAGVSYYSADLRFPNLEFQTVGYEVPLRILPTGY